MEKLRTILLPALSGIEKAGGHWTLASKKCYMSGTHVSKQDILTCLLFISYVDVFKFILLL